MVFKPISETREASDVSMYVWFIHSTIKDFTKIQRKKE